MNYYNDNDRHAVAWLKELIRCGHLPNGDVDDRSIEDVQPSDLLGYCGQHGDGQRHAHHTESVDTLEDESDG